MGLYGDLVQYKPTGAFSFEMFLRNSSSGRKGRRLFELFFLLPPVDYSMTEGYKVTVNKTINGAYVDDFGNDVKKIVLTGELYSYYFGNPATASKVGGKMGDALNAKKDELKEAVSDFTGHAGIDEFFKLRYILNRFRDAKTSPMTVFPPTPAERALFKIFPELFQLYQAIQEGNRPTNENFVWVYHDYDDGNHYEVVMNNFNAKRNKADPFTVRYTIDMTAIQEDSSQLKTFGKLGRGIKETGLSVIRNVKGGFDTAFSTLRGLTGIDDFGDALEVTRAAASIPASIKASWDSTMNLAEDFSNTWDAFIDGVRSDYSVYKADAIKAAEAIDLINKQYLAAARGISQEDLANEDKELDEDLLEIYNLLQEMKTRLITVSGIDYYGNNNEKQKIFIEEDEPSIEDTDFESETQGGGSTEKSQNNTQSVRYIYYIVEGGDTLAKLAHKFYADYTLQTVIGQANGIDNKSFENDALVGVSIKIPLLGTPVELQDDTNLVYSLITPQTPLINRQKQALGSDLYLTKNSRGLEADGTGDLRIVIGLVCYMENILDRFKYNQGILGPINPSWGLPFRVGDVPTPLKVQKLIQLVEEQTFSDPRTKNAAVKIEELDITADVARIPVALTPLTGSEQVIDIGKVIPGNFIN